MVMLESQICLRNVLETLRKQQRSDDENQADRDLQCDHASDQPRPPCCTGSAACFAHDDVQRHSEGLKRRQEAEYESCAKSNRRGKSNDSPVELEDEKTGIRGWQKKEQAFGNPV